MPRLAWAVISGLGERPGAGVPEWPFGGRVVADVEQVVPQRIGAAGCRLHSVDLAQEQGRQRFAAARLVRRNGGTKRNRTGNRVPVRFEWRRRELNPGPVALQRRLLRVYRVHVGRPEPCGPADPFA